MSYTDCESILKEANQAYLIAERTGAEEDWRYYHEVLEALNIAVDNKQSKGSDR